MVTIDDLKESLRAQLATLIDLYEAESSGPAHAGPAATAVPAGAAQGHGAGAASDGIGMRPASPRGDARSDLRVDGAGHADGAVGAPACGGKVGAPACDGKVEAAALAVETCLRDFAAAIDAAVAADAAAGALHALASGMLQRAADGRAVALMMRRDAEKRLRDLALGRTVVAFEAHRLAESQAAARISAALSRQSDAQASALCLRAREAAQWSLAALAAACRADPARGNAALDPRCARAALGDARAAAAKAGQLASVATDRVSPGGLESDLAGALEAVPGQESDAEPAPSAAGEPGIVAVAARDGADR